MNTRLKIIDLSPSGDQPLANEDSSIWAVLNGEIYNHLELRRWLQGRGHTFRGDSDTEVLPHLYEEHGVDVARHLRGMFAFAIFDTTKDHLVVSRDRFGIKPLFYSMIDSRDAPALAFASELNALLELPEVDDTVDRQALFDLVGLTYIPGPQTFYRGIRSLEPGQTLEVSFIGGQVATKTHLYHRWAMTPDTSLTLESASTRADRLLTQAVDRQLQSDVPLGSMLSGGVDSSLVSAAAASRLGGGLHTFNAKFSEEAYDETWAALAVAERIGSRHETLEVGERAVSWEHVVDLLAHAGQPFGDTSLFAMSALSGKMREHVAVVLSGDGGDEAFGGYLTFGRADLIVRLQSLPAPLWRVGAAGLRSLRPISQRLSRIGGRARNLANADDASILQQLMSYVGPAEQQQLMSGQDLEPTKRWFESSWPSLPATLSRSERIAALATEVYVRLALPNDYLFKVDTASMKESLEVRVPMLDEDLFDFALTLPSNLKTRGRTGKVVLREIAKSKLPAGVASKPKKGFGIPMDAVVDAAFMSSLSDALLDPGCGLPDLLGSKSYVPLVQAFARHDVVPGISREGLYQRVFTLLAVQVALDSARDRRRQRRP